MAARPEITGRATSDIEPLAVTFRTASQLTGLGLTTLWKYAKEGRICVIRPPGLRRTLIDFASVKELLAPEKTDLSDVRRRLAELTGKSPKAAP